MFHEKYYNEINFIFLLLYFPQEIVPANKQNFHSPLGIIFAKDNVLFFHLNYKVLNILVLGQAITKISQFIIWKDELNNHELYYEW